MKRSILNIVLALASVLGVSSCEKWLEATSSTSLPADKVFESRDGFSESLIGVYLDLEDHNLYGMAMTWQFADLIAYPYAAAISPAFKIVQSHLYKTASVENGIHGIWAMAYRTIANINIALEYLEKQKAIFSSEEEYMLYKGEFLALRAYLHLDLIRLFGHVDMSEANMSRKAIPYVLRFDKEPTQQLSYKETFDLLFDDIDTAIACLEASDPLAGKIDKSIFQTINQEGFWTNRRCRMNYAAALGLKARALQWLNRLDEAAGYAEQSVSAAFGSGLVSWANLDELLAEGYDKDLVLTPEQIFGLPILDPNAIGVMTLAPGVGNTGLMVPESFVDNVLYVRVDPVTGSMSGAEDIRGPSLSLNYWTTGYWCSKITTSKATYFPMIKVSEMYYIMAENLIDNGKNTEALKLLDLVRSHRGISEDLGEDANAEDELMKEYHREFINEGKLVYWLKHKNVTESICSSFSVKASDLVLPLPQGEIDYGRVQE